MIYPTTYPSREAEVEIDEFDIDIMSLSGTTVGWFGDPPKPTDPGSTCQFSCPHTCGGQCTYQSDCSGE
jgi:hypothetical protein